MNKMQIGTAVHVLCLGKVDLAEIAANLPPEEAHAVNDLTLYAVNTAALYRDRILPTIAHQAELRAGGYLTTRGPWLAIALEARRLYTAELKADPLAAVVAFRQGSVMAMVAAGIEANYEEEIEEQMTRA